MKANRLLVIATAFALLFVACEDEEKGKDTKHSGNEEPEAKSHVQTPSFNADSAYHFIERQVAFGPRVVNTESHAACAIYLQEKLERYGFQVLVQEGKVKAYDGTTLHLKNIIGQHKPNTSKRILLFAHWDTRPYADQDSINRSEPIPGANDGASGVGVLLEIARNIAQTEPNHGIDIIFFDAEDYGQPEGTIIQEQANTWGLGSQYWANNPPIPNYRAKYGILLDMVGAKDAIFLKEGISMKYAHNIVNKVWRTANRLGYGDRFISEVKYFVGADDHLFVNEIAQIPSIDIIQYNPESGGFGDYWHTHGDNMDIIDKATLQAVGHTVMEVIYQER